MKHQNIYNRLRRIEGQIRGIEDMVAKDKPEEQILIQLEAAKSSLASTISSLWDSFLIPEDNGKYSIDPEKAAILLKFLKKT